MSTLLSMLLPISQPACTTVHQPVHISVRHPLAHLPHPPALLFTHLSNISLTWSRACLPIRSQSDIPTVNLCSLYAEIAYVPVHLPIHMSFDSPICLTSRLLSRQPAFHPSPTSPFARPPSTHQHTRLFCHLKWCTLSNVLAKSKYIQSNGFS